MPSFDWVTTLTEQGVLGQLLGGRYVIDARIGEGSMGAVYRAHHAKMKRTFAVKVLHRRLLENPKMMRRFAREAELAGRLRHPNVIGVVDIGETDDGLHYLVMDFAGGVSLGSLIEHATLAQERVLDIARQLCDGLAHAHEMGLVHRDFKPENVIVDRDASGRDQPRIVDFGIAILRESIDSGEQDRLTTAGMVVGTPHYMSPEQARGEPIDHRTDLFALGLVMYEMLTGKLPFEGSGVDIARANMLEATPAMAERVPGLTVDPLIEALVQKLLAKDPAERPQTAAALREMLDLVEHHRIAAAKLLSAPFVPARRFPKASLHPPSAEEEEVERAQTQALSSDAIAASDVTSRPTTDVIPRHQRRRNTIVAAGLSVAIAAVLLLILNDRRATVAAPLVEPPPIAGIESPAITTMPDPAPAPVAPARITGPATAPPRQSPNLPRETPRPRNTPAITATPAAPAGTPTASELAALYGRVGRDLRRLEARGGDEAVFDLWPRYRWIRINEVLTTPDKRANAARMLAELQTDIAKR
jgi:serine/threonine protein kinase